MNRIVRLFLAAIGGCSKSNVLTPGQFTSEFVESLRRSQSDLDVVIVSDLELKVTSADGRASTSFLNNAYDTYKQAPKSKADVIQRFVTAGLETVNSLREGVDRTRIVPVIKHRAWLVETCQAMLSRGAKEIPEHVYEDFSPDLIVLYAEDSPKNIRYLVTKDLEVAKIDRAELRKLACENLSRLLPKIKHHGTNGLYMLTAGGDYEASLLLLDSVWNGGQMDVTGDLVVAIPTRDLLLATGSRNPQGIEKMKQMADEAFGRFAYRLTRKLLVYRNGSFSEFNESAETGNTPNGNRSLLGDGHHVPPQ